MLPEYSVKHFHYQNSKDNLSFVFTLSILFSAIVFYVMTSGWHKTSPIGLVIVALMVLGLLGLLKVPRFANNKYLNSGGLAGLFVYNVTIYVILIWYEPLFSPFIFLVYR